MSHQDPYDAWKQARARADVPADFADRVLAAVRAQPAAAGTRISPGRTLLLSRAVGVGIGSLACAACLLRLLQVLALFLVGQPSL